MLFWYFFSQNNWHDGGNSTEQYARTLSVFPCVYVHGGKNKKRKTYNQMRIITQRREEVLRVLNEEVGCPKVAMFTRPKKIFLDFMQQAKEMGIKTVYRSVDDWQLWKDSSSWYNRGLELKMIRLADLAVATSAKLSNIFGIRRLPNACQRIKYGKVFQKEAVIGFLGDVDNQVSSARVDIDLVIYLAKRFPHLQFKLIGSRKVWDELPSNIHISPYVKWQEANATLADIDIGLIPYVGEDISGVQPTKSWEYMGYGIPQVAREGLDLPQHSSVRTYRTYEECAKVVSDLVANLSKINTEDIITFASKNTWQDRINQIMEWL